MKKILFVLAIAASLQAFDAQAQVKSPAAAKSAVEKTQAATENPKQNTKFGTWMKYGQALMDAYNSPSGNVWAGMSRQEYNVVAGNEKPVSETAVEVGGQKMTKLTFANKNLYFNQAGALSIIEVTQPVVENALDKAVEAYSQAIKLDDKGQKTADFKKVLGTIAGHYSEEAYNDYSFGKPADASVLFEKAANTAAMAPLSQIDTNSIYNAGYTAWQASENDRAKEFLLKSIKYGYAGTDGDAYAKLGDLEQKAGNKEAGKNYLEEGFVKYPQSQSILVGLINFYVNGGENTDRIFELLSIAKKNEPTNASLYYVEGNIREKLGQEAEAVAAYNKCSEINPSYEYGYVGLGTHYYNKAVEIQDKASKETDDAKYMALMGQFETSLKACIPPFEKAYDLLKDADAKKAVAEYLKNACFRFRSEGATFVDKYNKYKAASE